MAKIDNDELIQEYMKSIVKVRKAKCTYTCIYKKEPPYFWQIKIIPYIQGQYTILVDIKLWEYDEFLTSITHPDEPQHFTDKMRYQGFFAMKPYRIIRRDIDAPIDPITNIADTDKLKIWCEDVFNDAIDRIDTFTAGVKKEYGGLNDYLISNTNNDPITAAFACLFVNDYEQAERLLNIAVKNGFIFDRSFGSVNRDLRDVLLDYCHAKQSGKEWTRNMVLGGQ